MVTVKEPPTAPDSRPRHSTSVSGLSSRQWPDSGPTVARQRPTAPDTPTVRAQGHVAFHKGDYYDAIYIKNNHVVPLIVEVFGGIASRGARYLRFLARRASDRKRGRDGTAYSDYHASGGFLAHHLARISMAAVYWDAQHIDEGVRFLKQHAQPHA